VLDNVDGVEVRYFGDPLPPALVDPARGQLTTYGPEPPPIGVALGDYWPPGTNCTIDLAQTPGDGDTLVQVPRLPALRANAGGLVALHDPSAPETSLGDGPWCPDPLSPRRWDADLLRVRRVRITVRLQNSIELFRSGRAAPSEIVTFDVTPRSAWMARR
jgi:hypothetical protein